MKEYQTVMLFIYPKLERFSNDVKKLVDALACECGCGEDAEKSVRRVMEYMYVRDLFIVLKSDLDEVFSLLTEEEKFMLEYKYFRRRKVLGGEFAAVQMNCSERTYFRRQNRLENKLNALFLQRGMTQEWFEEKYGNICCVAEALRAVKRGADNGFADRRARRGLRFASGNERDTVENSGNAARRKTAAGACRASGAAERSANEISV